jgi:hypothetical protein
LKNIEFEREQFFKKISVILARAGATHDEALSLMQISDKKTPLIQYWIEPKGFVT